MSTPNTGIQMPSISVAFEKAAELVIGRLKQGVVVVMVRDTSIKATKSITLRGESNIPTDWPEATRNYAARALTGSSRGTPSRVYALTVIPEPTSPEADAPTNFALALEALRYLDCDYIVAPLDATTTELTALQDWISEQRKLYRTYKAVLPNTAADDCAIINCVMDGTKFADGTTLDAEEMCPLVAGILAGIPSTCSVTNVPVKDVVSVPDYGDVDAQNAKVGAGELFLVHDGFNALMSTGVNSLTSVDTAPHKGWCKIKFVEAADLISAYLRQTYNRYCGAVTGKYANKQLIIAGILNYFRTLEGAEVLGEGSGTASIDVAAQEQYLIAHTVDTSKMTDDEIAQANTGNLMAVKFSADVLDALEVFEFSGALNM